MYYEMIVSALILGPTGQGVKGQYRRVGLIEHVWSGSIEFEDAARRPKYPVEDSNCVEISIDEKGRNSFLIEII
jgi:hypothetical protein